MTEPPRTVPAEGPAAPAPTATPARPATPAAPQHSAKEPTAWVGWVLFASIMLIMVGAFQAMMGVVALLDDGYYLVPGTDLVVHLDYSTWGWTHVGLGVIAVVAGLGILAGQTWARVVGVMLAVLSALVNVAFLAAYPIWSVLIITLDVIIIYALAVHGREVRY